MKTSILNTNDLMHCFHNVCVIPAKAGIIYNLQKVREVFDRGICPKHHKNISNSNGCWIPAFAGMTPPVEN